MKDGQADPNNRPNRTSLDMGMLLLRGVVHPGIQRIGLVMPRLREMAATNRFSYHQDVRILCAALQEAGGFDMSASPRPARDISSGTLDQKSHGYH
jgi:hypothetical protein